MADLIPAGTPLNAGRAAINKKVADMDSRLNNIVGQTGNDNTEIRDARFDSEENVTYPILGARLNAMSLALGEKAAKSYVDSEIASKVSGSPKAAYATLSALQAAYPTGETGIFVVTADGKWYFWNGSAWTAGGLYQSPGIAANSIGVIALKNPTARVITEGTAKLDLQAKTLTVVGTLRFMIDQKDYAINTQVQDISGFLALNPTNIHIIYADISANTIGIMKATVDAVMPSNQVILFVEYGGRAFEPNARAIQIIDSSGKDVSANVSTNYATQSIPSNAYANRSIPAAAYSLNSVSQLNLQNPVAEIINDGTVRYNLQAKTIQLTAVTRILVDQNNYALPAQTVDISTFLAANPTNIHIVYADINALTVGIMKASNDAALSSNQVILFIEYGGKLFGKNVPVVTFIDATGTDVSWRIATGVSLRSVAQLSLKNPVADIITDGILKYNLQSKTLQISGTLRFLVDQQDYAFNTQTVDISAFLTANPTNIHIIYADFSNNTVAIMKATPGGIMPANTAILFTEYSGKLFGKNIKSIIYTDASGNDATFGKATALPTFVEASSRLLLPPTMYFVDDLILPIYKSAIVSSFDAIEAFKTNLINIKADGTPEYRNFTEDHQLDPTKLASTFKIAVAQKDVDGYEYFGQISKNSVTPTAKNGVSFKYLAIGDSLTENGVPGLAKTKLQAYGVTANLLGSYNNGEGRSGWSFRNFIGKGNRLPDNSQLSVSTSGTSTRFQNPFLKLADATDKANHPTWCFRNTGALKELSYSEDTDKTGDFYIFDFANYLAAHSIATPDVVTIALGTNDLLNYAISDSIPDNRLAMEIMIKQIKASNANIKIGIVPSTGWINSTAFYKDVWTNRVALWIEQCMTDVKALQATYTGLYIIPIWCHMSRRFSWDYSSTVDLSSTNQTKKAQIGDSLHYGTAGKIEYSNTMSSFLLNIV